MSKFESEVLAQLEREDPEEAQAYREEIEEREDILEDFDKEYTFEFE
jgi:hypothetical protein